MLATLILQTDEADSNYRRFLHIFDERGGQIRLSLNCYYRDLSYNLIQHSALYCYKDDLSYFYQTSINAVVAISPL